VARVKARGYESDRAGLKTSPTFGYEEADTMAIVGVHVDFGNGGVQVELNLEETRTLHERLAALLADSRTSST
jgi:hypothetical protein